MKKVNFYAGPSILPGSVMKKASNAVREFDDTGLSLIEISHRSKEWVQVMADASDLAKELLGVPEGYKVLFLQGGASTQFIMLPYNLMKQGGKAAYLDTGSWASKAIKEAGRLGEVKIVASSKDKNYNYIPKDFDIDTGCDYFHITTNNTIYGTEISNPDSLGEAMKNLDIPLVADMSSNIFSRPIDVSKFDLIYAGAQKNLGPAGVTLVIVKEEILGKTGRNIPSMLDYSVQISKDSMFNTAPVFAIYTSYLTMQWLKQKGGVAWVDKRNQKKADMLYEAIDSNPLFEGTAEREDRSRMNVTFVLKDPELESKFLAMCDRAGIVGIKGHRSVGGFRASIYNAMKPKGVKALVEVMEAFGRKYG